MNSIHMKLFVITYCAFYYCVSGNVKSVKNSDYDFLADILFNISSDFDPYCIITVTHDYQSLRINFKKLAAIKNDSMVLVINQKTEILLDNIPVSSTKTGGYWFSWLHEDSLVRTRGTCGIHFISGKPENLPEMVVDLAAGFLLDTTRHYFFLVPTISDIKELNLTSILKHPNYDIMKYKVIVTKEDGRIKYYTHCFFCRNENIIQVRQDSVDGNLVSKIFPDLTRNLNGTFLKGTFLESFDRSGTQYRFKNFHPIQVYHMFMLLFGDKLNFDWIVEKFGESGSADIQMEDGTWTGMVAEVLYGRVDFAAIATMTGKTIAAVDYPTVSYVMKVNYMTRKPQPLHSWKTLIKPFAKESWLGLFAAWIFGAVIFWILINGSPADNDDAFFKVAPNLLQYAFIATILPLIEENPDRNPRTHSLRVFIIFWWFYAIIATVAYNSKLIAMLAFPELEQIPNNFEELTDGRKWTWGGQYEQTLFFKMKIEDSSIPYLWAILPKIITYPTVAKCLEAAVHENFACISAALWLEQQRPIFTDKYGYNPLMMQDEKTITSLCGIMLPKHSILSPSFKNVMNGIWESGLQEYFAKRTVETVELRSIFKAKQSSFFYSFSKALKNQQLQGMYFLLLLGECLGLVIFILERISKKASKKK